MATRKQRRRRKKELRHEYEYVYVDEEGNVIEVEDSSPPRKEKERKAMASGNGRPARGGRPVQAPDWRFIRKQAIIFFVILLAAFTLFSGGNLVSSAPLAAIYTVLMMPLMWLMQRTLYRSYLKRIGQLPPPRERRPK